MQNSSVQLILFQPLEGTALWWLAEAGPRSTLTAAFCTAHAGEKGRNFYISLTVLNVFVTPSYVILLHSNYKHTEDKRQLKRIPICSSARHERSSLRKPSSQTLRQISAILSRSSELLRKRSHLR